MKTIKLPDNIIDNSPVNPPNELWGYADNGTFIDCTYSNFTLGGIQYPSNFVSVSTKEEKYNIGLGRLITDKYPKKFNKSTQKIVENKITRLKSGDYKLSYSVVDLTQDEIEVLKTNRVNFVKEFLGNFAKTSLDNFAKTRGYDDIISLCSFVSSANQSFKSDAEIAIKLRDKMREAVDSIIKDVYEGKITIPDEHTDLVNLLPKLTWSND